MEVNRYLQAWDAAGRRTVPPYLRPYRLTRGIPIDLPQDPNAVYIACAEGQTRYVGSTTRGVGCRLAEHVRQSIRASWEEMWIIGIDPQVSRYGVLLAEERVGFLLKPSENVRPAGR